MRTRTAKSDSNDYQKKNILEQLQRSLLIQKAKNEMETVTVIAAKVTAYCGVYKAHTCSRFKRERMREYEGIPKIPKKIGYSVDGYGILSELFQWMVLYERYNGSVIISMLINEC